MCCCERWRTATISVVTPTWDVHKAKTHPHGSVWSTKATVGKNKKRSWEKVVKWNRFFKVQIVGIWAKYKRNKVIVLELFLYHFDASVRNITTSFSKSLFFIFSNSGPNSLHRWFIRTTVCFPSLCVSFWQVWTWLWHSDADQADRTETVLRKWSQSGHISGAIRLWCAHDPK